MYRGGLWIAMHYVDTANRSHKKWFLDGLRRDVEFFMLFSVLFSPTERNHIQFILQI